jgi:hypothetical protein
MSSQIDRRSLAERLGLECLIVDPPGAACEGGTMIRDRWRYDELDWDCPHCGFPAHLLLLDSTNNDDANWVQPAAGIEIGNEDSDPGEHVVYLLCRCPRASCKGFVFAVADAETRRIKQAYPYTRATADSFERSIPQNIREDFAEATRAIHATAYKASVVMCRRVIQDIAKEKHIPGDTNKEQIKQMNASGLITKPMFDAAHEIRHYGGFGAHPQDDGLDEITRETAESLLELTNQFLQNIYVMAGRNAELAKRRQATAQPSKPPNTAKT